MAKPKPPYANVAFVASDTPDAQDALASLVNHYGNRDPKDADAIVALGGDGLMLQTLHRYMNDQIPIFGMNCGSVGFLMNEYREEALHERLAQAEVSRIHPLAMVAYDTSGKAHKALAINEVSLFRETAQAAKLRILVDGKERMSELVCDGCLLSTPAGSTAYNYSAHGPILPIGADVLALTAVAAFRPRRWRGALLPKSAVVRFEVLDPEKRPVRADADTRPVTNVLSVEIRPEPNIRHRILFDPGHGLEERLIVEQFA